jgi:hypothetical protein
MTYQQLLIDGIELTEDEAASFVMDEYKRLRAARPKKKRRASKQEVSMKLRWS